ncbi:hypothetical protein, partial [Pseudomonas huaxiensis]|uniref:hypothetical protein n=1 Tax=Pseudomonas huaxiensis TaxID=2213017 RepID=UPI001CDC3FA1
SPGFRALEGRSERVALFVFAKLLQNHPPLSLLRPFATVRRTDKLAPAGASFYAAISVHS